MDNFGIYVDNYHCDVNDEVSCPRTLIVRHETQEVLIKTVRMMPIAVQVRWRGGRPYAAGGWAAPDPEPGLERRSEDTSHGLSAVSCHILKRPSQASSPNQTISICCFG